MRRSFVFSLTAVLLLQALPVFTVSALGQAQVIGAVQAVNTGTLAGTAVSTKGEIISNFLVQARSLASGQVVGQSTTNLAGGFSFTGLNPASYVVELVGQTGAVVSSSAAATVGAGVVTSVTVTATPSALALAAGSAAAAGATGAAGAATAGAAGTAAGATAAGTAAAGGIGAGFLGTALIVTTVAAAAGVAGVVVVARDPSPSR